MATLDARAGAPLPLSEVLYEVKRLDPWLPGRAIRYAAFYVRTKDAGGDFQSAVEVGGRTIQVSFLSRANRNRKARQLAILAAVTGGFALVVSGALTSALAIRGDSAERLSALEQISTARARSADTQERRRVREHALDAAGVRHLKVDDVLKDLAWASASKNPSAHIDALHWRRGHMAVEVRGDGTPFLAGDRPVVRAEKPLRPRVWLWGVEPARRGKREP